MRIRQVKPEFWSDSDMAELPPPARLTYIGLWNIADDAGWFVADLSHIAHELYGYDGRAQRERTVADHLFRLQEIGRVVIELCGHAVIPTLPDHQRQNAATRRVETVKKEHAQCVTADIRSAQRRAAESRSVTVGNGKERYGTVVARESSDEPTVPSLSEQYAAIAGKRP